MICLATIAYAPAHMIREMLVAFRGQNPRNDYHRHAIFNAKFPLVDAQRQNEALRLLAQEFEAEFVEMPGNLGCHQNFNFALDHMGAGEGDVFAPVCTDSRSSRERWIKALAEVLTAEPNYFTVQLNHSFDYAKLGGTIKVVGGHEVLEFNQLCSWPTGMFNAGLIKQIGGFGAHSRYYGYIEHYLVEKFAPLGKRWALIRNYYDHNSASVKIPVYTEWKQACAAKSTESSFEEWVRQRNSPMLEV